MRKCLCRQQLEEELSKILLGEKIPLDIVDSETGEILIPANRRWTKTAIRKVASRANHFDIDPSPIGNRIKEIVSSIHPWYCWN